MKKKRKENSKRENLKKSIRTPKVERKGKQLKKKKNRRKEKIKKQIKKNRGSGR